MKVFVSIKNILRSPKIPEKLKEEIRKMSIGKPENQNHVFFKVINFDSRPEKFYVKDGFGGFMPMPAARQGEMFDELFGPEPPPEEVYCQCFECQYPYAKNELKRSWRFPKSKFGEERKRIFAAEMKKREGIICSKS